MTEICTTYSACRRHLSLDLCAGASKVPGRMGTTLCSETAYDLDRVLCHLAVESRKLPGASLDALPCCRNCERNRRRFKLDAPEGWAP